MLLFGASRLMLWYGGRSGGGGGGGGGFATAMRFRLSSSWVRGGVGLVWGLGLRFRDPTRRVPQL